MNIPYVQYLLRMIFPYTMWLNDNDNDNDNILVDHNVQIEIIIYNNLENQIINWSRNYY